MRYVWLMACGLIFATAAQAGQTLRIDSQVLTIGDSAVHVADLLGKPLIKVPIQNEFGAYVGERWQYRHEGHVVTVTLINGKVADIDDRPT